MPDRAALFSDILQRNTLRRDAHLPCLPVRETYERELRLAVWREYVEQHGAQAQADVLHDLRARHGSDFPQSGGRMAVDVLTWKALREGFEARSPSDHGPEHRP